MNTKINELKKEEMIVMNRTNEEIRKKEGILETVKMELQVFPLILFWHQRNFRHISSSQHHCITSFYFYLQHSIYFYFLILLSICKLLFFF